MNKSSLDLMLKLYGSKTSPYVRRTRLLLKDHPFEFAITDIFSREGREELKKISPILKIPVLQDGDLLIFDSRNIYEYLSGKGICPALTFKQKNELAIIDGLNDSLINLLLLKRSNMTLPRNSVLGRSHYERIELCLKYLEQASANAQFGNWDYLSMSLFTVLDWAMFRELLTLEESPHLVQFLTKCRSFPESVQTDPRGA